MPEDNERKEGIKLSKKLISYVIAACIVISFYFLLRNSRSVSLAFDHVYTVIQPIIMGFIMAFLMNPIMVFFEKRITPLLAKVIKSEEKSKM